MRDSLRVLLGDEWPYALGELSGRELGSFPL